MICFVAIIEAVSHVENPGQEIRAYNLKGFAIHVVSAAGEVAEARGLQNFTDVA